MADETRPPRQWPGPPGRPEHPPAPPAATDAPTAAAAADGVPDEPRPGTDDATVGPRDVDQVDQAVEQAEEQVEADLGDLGELTTVVAERDEYLDRLQRLQADFENYKKRVAKQQTEHRERAAEELVTQLLPVLDNFDLALVHGAEALAPVHRSMFDILSNSGLERLDPVGQPFDPNEHDAVLHEAAEGEPEVIEVLRAGYRWKGRVLRPAMVKVKG